MPYPVGYLKSTYGVRTHAHGIIFGPTRTSTTTTARNDTPAYVNPSRRVFRCLYSSPFRRPCAENQDLNSFSMIMSIHERSFQSLPTILPSFLPRLFDNPLERNAASRMGTIFREKKVLRSKQRKTSRQAVKTVGQKRRKIMAETQTKEKQTEEK